MPPPPARTPSRQPACAPMLPLSVRESRMPISSPLITVPTVRPRRAETAAAAYGTTRVRRHADQSHDRSWRRSGCQRVDRRRERDDHEGQHRERRGADDQAFALEAVAQRHEQEKARRHAELGRGGDAGRGVRPRRGNVVAMPAEQRLTIIDVGNGSLRRSSPAGQSGRGERGDGGGGSAGVRAVMDMAVFP